MKCPKCQFENSEGAKYCSECGHLFLPSSTATSHAFSLDEKLEKIQRYLPKGLTEKILSQKNKIEGERKQVTVMFCDMVGFTPLVTKLGPEEAYFIMDQVYEILIHKVHDFEGIVNEMTGDGIMALFGAPIALEDAPQRALWSALSIHRQIAKFNDQNKEMGPIRMRIGIHTGPVVVGTLGNDLRVEFKAVGDTVNLASRMEKLAEAQTTYVTEETFKLTRLLFQFEAVGKKTVKGVEKPIHVYKVLSGKKDVYRPRLGSERRIYSRLIGRDNELDRLELQVMKLINGEGSIVSIIGEAGIGKSRLVAELTRREIIKKVALFEGRAISMGRNLSFHPIIDILKQWAQINQDDAEAVAFNKLETAVRNLCLEAVNEVLPFVATLMQMKLSGMYAERIKGIEGEALEKLILKNVRELLIRAAELTPLVIVLEDMHWADASSIELIESLFRLAETKRILFINVFRPGHRETGDRIVETIKEKLSAYNVDIVLEPLDEKLSKTLVTNILNITRVYHAVIGQIVQRSGGNPFFIEEIVRSLIDERAVILKSGTFEVTERINSIAIPNSINGLLMARIDRLAEETRNLVMVASVIGRNFFYRILAEVAGAIENIDGRLSYLKEKQIIRERRRMGEVEYLFKHALTQEATYESILPQKLKVLHLKVARSIENVFTDRIHEFYGMLAYHNSKGEHLSKAEDYLIKAGKEALKSSASIEALNYYTEALKLYIRQHGDDSDPDKLAMFEKNIAIALFNKFQYAKAIEYFDSVLERRGAGSPKNKILLAAKFFIDLLAVIKNLYFPSKRGKKNPDQSDNEVFDLIQKRSISLTYVDSKRFFIESVALLRNLNKFNVSKIENGISLYAGASALFSWTGLSFKLSKKALEIARDFTDKNDIKAMLYYRVFELIYNYLYGNWDNIKEFDENLLDLNLRIGEFWPISIYMAFYGYLKIDRGEFNDAEMIIKKLSEIYDDYEAEKFRVNLYALKGKLLLKSGELQEAQLEVDAGIAFDIQSGMELQHLFFLGFKASICILLKDIRGAQQSLSQAKGILKTKDRIPPFFISSYLISQFLFDLCLLEKSILSRDKSNISEYRMQAYKSGKNALNNSGKNACDRTEALRLMGIYYWLAGNQSKAVKWWNKSIAEGERLGARIELARTYMEIGKRLLMKESRFHELNGIQAETYLEKATALFKKMNLHRDLAEFEAMTV